MSVNQNDFDTRTEHLINNQQFDINWQPLRMMQHEGPVQLISNQSMHKLYANFSTAHHFKLLNETLL